LLHQSVPRLLLSRNIIMHLML